MTRWEYCWIEEVTEGDGRGSAKPLTCHTPISLDHVHDWEPLHLEIAVAVAHLGEDGWEMAGFSVVRGNRTCWFKRPIEDRSNTCPVGRP